MTRSPARSPELGLHVRGYDHRGHGLSQGERGVIPRAEALLEDLRRVFDGLAAEQGEAPLLLGHSLGGALAARSRPARRPGAGWRRGP